ncbi:hypothetical protein BDQ17DRAFT_1207286, partial [Cyathus striatus]
SSVDAEHAFSVGHRQINFMQHNVTSTTFRAKIALGSWSKRPLSPGIHAVSAMLSTK